jgi:hypothetical protein
MFTVIILVAFIALIVGSVRYFDVDGKLLDLPHDYIIPFDDNEKYK